MKTHAANIFLALFLFLTLIDLGGIANELPLIHQFAKPLLMPALMLSLFFSPTPFKAKKLIIAGLFFSFLGDVLLLFETRHPLFFILGLASFLITHICYIIYFLQVRSPLPSLLRRQPWIPALIAAYGVSLVRFLLPFLGALQIPVIIYAAVICLMFICSLHIFLKISTPSNILFSAGAFLFVASDSFLAFNKFYASTALGAVIIMATYCAAQFCIVQAVIKRSW